MSRRTKSVDDPPICRPALIPPTEYIAGVDHLPSKFWPPRQSKGPRPPLPPIPKPNFFTLGRMSTQSALDNDASEILLLLRKPCNTKLAPRRVSSSFFLSAANTGRIISNTMEVRNQGKSLREILLLVFSNAVRSMSSSFLFCVRPADRLADSGPSYPSRLARSYALTRCHRRRTQRELSSQRRELNRTVAGCHPSFEGGRMALWSSAVHCQKYQVVAPRLLKRFSSVISDSGSSQP